MTSPAFTRPRAARSKIDWVVSDCLYRIATGAWPPGSRLPALRSATDLWSVNEVTCLRAYRRLIALGVVESRPRSGYFVADAEPVSRLSRHRTDLERLYESFQRQVRARTELSVVGAARAIAQLAELKAIGHPECAFAECTHFQAAGHAQEVATRLGISCLSLTTGDIDGRTDRIPPQVRTLLTTHYHFRELTGLGRSRHLRVVPVPIELSPKFVAEVKATPAKEVIVLALAGPLAKSIAADLRARVGRRDLRFRSRGTSIATLHGLLGDLLGAAPATRRMAILSTSLWSGATHKWRDRSDVRPFVYQILESAWPDLADAVGMPLELSCESRPKIEQKKGTGAF